MRVRVRVRVYVSEGVYELRGVYGHWTPNNFYLDVGVGVELGRRHAIEHQRRIAAHFDLGHDQRAAGRSTVGGVRRASDSGRRDGAAAARRAWFEVDGR